MRHSLNARLETLEAAGAAKHDGRRVVAVGKAGYLLTDLEQAMTRHFRDQKRVHEIRLYNEATGLRLTYLPRPDIPLKAITHGDGASYYEGRPYRDKLPEYFYFFAAFGVEDEDILSGAVSVQAIAEAGGLHPVQICRGDTVLSEEGFRAWRKELDDAVTALFIEGRTEYARQSAKLNYLGAWDGVLNYNPPEGGG